MDEEKFNVFVYGTLKTDFPNHYLMKDHDGKLSKLVKPGKTLNKFPLVVASFCRIPFLLNSPGVGYNVEGEVYSVNRKMLQFLDEFEGHPQLYTRSSIEIQLDEPLDSGKKVLSCGCYMLNNFKDELLENQFLVCYKVGDSKSYIEEYDNSDAEEEIIKSVKQ